MTHSQVPLSYEVAQFATLYNSFYIMPIAPLIGRCRNRPCLCNVHLSGYRDLSRGVCPWEGLDCEAVQAQFKTCFVMEGPTFDMVTKLVGHIGIGLNYTGQPLKETGTCP